MLYKNNLSANEKDVFVYSDNVIYDEENKIITARENIKIFTNNKIIFTDEISYHLKSDRLEAIGSIKLIDEEFNIIFANKLLLDNNLKVGEIISPKIRFKDNSLLAANKGIYYQNKYVLNEAVYSACPVCKGKKPEWQIKAQKITYNDVKKNIAYNNAFFEIYGIPVLYIPYFSHSTNHSQAKSGFLTPKYKRTSELGPMLKIPFYLRIADDKDLTYSQILNSKNHLFFEIDYNHLLKQGKHNSGLSFIRDGNRNRGHIQSEGKYNLNKYWVMNYNIKATTDKTYLKNYKFSDQDHINSNIALTNINNYNYNDLKFISFQSLNDYYSSNNNSFIFPYSSSHYKYKISDDSNIFYDNSFMILHNRSSYNNNRIINNLGYFKTITNKLGHVFDFIGSARIDGYNYNDQNQNENYVRLAPNLQMNWNYPLLKNIKNSTILLKPIANIIHTELATSGKNIKPEDSYYLELSDENLFKANRWPGYDKIESGTRINYAINTVLDNDIGNFDFLLGQSYRLNKKFNGNDYELIYKSGLRDRASDYVGRMNYMINTCLKIFYKFRIDKRDGNLQRNDIGLDGSYKILNFNVKYISFNESYQKQLQISNKQIYIHAALNLNDRWSIDNSLRKNLSKENKKMISATGNIHYRGDCIDYSGGVAKDYTRNKEQNKNSISYFFNISLRNITY